MSERKRLARERLQVYYATLLMAYRPLILICGILLFVYAFMTIAHSLWSGVVIGILAVSCLLLGNSYPLVVFAAKLAAWVVTVGRKKD